MKNLLYFLLGFFLIIILSLSNYLAFSFNFKFSLPIFTTMIFVQIVICIVVFLIFKNKPLRIGIFVSSLIIILLCGIIYYRELSYIEKKARSKESNSLETIGLVKSEQDMREEYMKDTTLTLYEKFSKMKLGKLSDSLVIAFSIKKDPPLTNSQFTINSLKIDFSYFKILKQPKEKYYQSKNNFEYSKDTLLKITAKNNLKITKPLLPPYKSDSTTYVGYLSMQNLFITADGRGEHGIDYKSINSINGQEIDGIPLFKNPENKYFSFVYFRHFIGYLELDMKFWTLDKNNHYQLIHEEIIPLNTYIRNYTHTSFDISKIEWKKTSFSFILTDHNPLKKAAESILIESKIVKLK